MVKKLTVMRESDQAYGRIEAFLHVAGYTIGRAFADVEELLDKRNRWKEFGYATVKEFLASFNFKEIEATLETKKRLAKRIQELQPTVSNRLAAKVVGVDEGTLRADKSAKAKQKAKEKQRKSADRSAGQRTRPSGDEAAKTVARAARIQNNQQVIAERTEKIALDAAKLGKSTVLLADPAWDDEFGKSDRSIENHYATMTSDEILALPVSEIAHDQAVLFLWATPSMIEAALQTMKAWGFEYRTQMVWVKPSIGLGKYVRQRHEILLIGRRGDHPAPLSENLSDSVIEAPRGEHSAKPEIFHEIIERMYPDAARIELFRRGTPRKGWLAWGAEAKEAAE